MNIKERKKLTPAELVERGEVLRSLENNLGFKIYCEEIDKKILAIHARAQSMAGTGQSVAVEAMLLEAKGLSLAGMIYKNMINEGALAQKKINEE